MDWLKGFRVRCAGLIVPGAILLGGCDGITGLLDVELPAKVPADELRTPEAADLLVRSSKNAFRCALTNYINVSGFASPEFAIAQFAGATIFYDQRFWQPAGYWALYAQADCTNGAALYLPLSRARWMGDYVLGLLDEWSPDEVDQHNLREAEAAAYTGYSYILMGEAMCSVAFDEGPEQSTADAFELAVARFDRGIAAATAAGSDDLLNLSRVGKARALLNLGQLAAAAAVAAEVPEDFVFEMDYSGGSTATYNKQWEMNHRDQDASVEAPYRTMSFGGVPDPRVKVTDQGSTGVGTDVEIWTADKYSASNSPVEVATWEEAQLILAEVAVAEGRHADAVEIINRLHAKVGLPAFASNDPDEIMQQILYERRAEFFLEGHQLGDIRRYSLPLYPASGEPFLFGGTYAAQDCFPLPEVETLNNPSI